MRSWIGLYALLKMIRDAKMTDVHPRRASPTMLQAGEGRPDARHVRRRELDAEPRPPGPLQAGRDQPLGDLRVGPEREAPAGSRATSSRRRRSASTRCCAARPSVRPSTVLTGRRTVATTPRLGHEPRKAGDVQSFLQFLIIGLGAGATYALVRAGRGAHLPRLGPGQLRPGRDRHLRGLHRVRRPQGRAGLGDASRDASSRWSPPARCRSRSRRSSSARCGDAAAIVRVIATIGLLGLLQAVVAKRYGVANQPVDSYLPHDGVHVGRHHRPGGADLPRRASRWS